MIMSEVMTTISDYSGDDEVSDHQRIVSHTESVWTDERVRNLYRLRSSRLPLDVMASTLGVSMGELMAEVGRLNLDLGYERRRSSFNVKNDHEKLKPSLPSTGQMSGDPPGEPYVVDRPQGKCMWMYSSSSPWMMCSAEAVDNTCWCDVHYERVWNKKFIS